MLTLYECNALVSPTFLFFHFLFAEVPRAGMPHDSPALKSLFLDCAPVLALRLTHSRMVA